MSPTFFRETSGLMTLQIWFQNGYVVEEAPHISRIYVPPFSFAKDKYRQHAAHLPKDLKLVLGGAVSACSTYRDEAAAKKEPHVVNPAAQPSAPVLRFVVLPLTPPGPSPSNRTLFVGPAFLL